MKIFDITISIHPQMPVWPGDPAVQLGRVAKIEEGANANVSHLSLSAHTGTHVDAPYHFLGHSPLTVELLPLEILTGPAVVLHLPETVHLVTAEVLEACRIPPRTRRLLLRTRNSNYWKMGEMDFKTGFVGIDVGAANFLVARGIRLIGIDYLSIAPYKNSRPTHEALLKAGMVILEGVNLADVEAGRYTLTCLPLKLVGADGAPARAILTQSTRR